MIDCKIIPDNIAKRSKMFRNINLKNFIVFLVIFTFILGISIDANAQRRRTKARKTPAAATQPNNSADIKKGAEDVAIQLKNVSRFVFVLGGVAKGIEDIDKAVKEGKASREIANKNAQFKDDVITSIRALRAGLIRLDVDFRANPALRKYMINLQNVAGQSARAEDLALAGRFNDSGKELLLVVETLTDTLVAMP
jgi:hypothetical protein